jgi:predicted RNA polymerase sigma factor
LLDSFVAISARQKSSPKMRSSLRSRHGRKTAFRASPAHGIVELNRAVAIAFADGPAAGLAIVDELAKLPALEGYHLVPAVRADFLSRLGRRDEARAELERAASLTKNDRERALLLKRAAGMQN